MPVLGTVNRLVRDAFGLGWLQGNAPSNSGFLDPLLGVGYVA